MLELCVAGLDRGVCVRENFGVCVLLLWLRRLCAVGWVGHPWIVFQFENIESCLTSYIIASILRP